MSEKKARKPKPVANAIEAAISAVGLSTSYHGWMVVQKWPELVGEHIAKQAKAFRFDDGILFVAVKDSSWRQNLAMETENILAKIRSYPFGRVIKQIRLTASERG